MGFDAAGEELAGVELGAVGAGMGPGGNHLAHAVCGPVDEVEGVEDAGKRVDDAGVEPLLLEQGAELVVGFLQGQLGDDFCAAGLGDGLGGEEHVREAAVLAAVDLDEAATRPVARAAGAQQEGAFVQVGVAALAGEAIVERGKLHEGEGLIDAGRRHQVTGEVIQALLGVAAGADVFAHLAQRAELCEAVGGDVDVVEGAVDLAEGPEGALGKSSGGLGLAVVKRAGGRRAHGILRCEADSTLTCGVMRWRAP